MPELPEVESIRNQLSLFLIGHKIEKIVVHLLKTFPEGKEKIVGGKIKKVRRFGKVLVIDLDNEFSLIIHVKMTGQLIYKGPNIKHKQNLSKKVLGGIPGKHTHVIFELDKEGYLFFNDVRKFGWMKVVKNSDVERSKFIVTLGAEPLKDLTLQKFVEILSLSKKPVKLLLMDQEKISGIGNIYANDALWLAKIHPKRESLGISSSGQKDLLNAIETVLKKGIEKGGSSEVSYVKPDGGEGKYQHFTLAYGKVGQLCKRCRRAKINKIKLGGRGTYFCPFCQKLI